MTQVLTKNQTADATLREDITSAAPSRDVLKHAPDPSHPFPVPKVIER